MEDIKFYNTELNLRDIAENENISGIEEAVYVCDLSDIIQKYSLWKQLMPRVTPFYAVKCNDHPTILRLLSLLGTGFDCASKAEISKVLDLNVESDRIIFANPTKPASHILYARDAGVYTMTFDSEFELLKVKQLYPQASLVLRIRCEAEKAQCPLGEKFGCDPELEAPKLLKAAKNLDLNVIGISFHVGSGCEDFPVYDRAISAAKKLFDIGTELGYSMNLLDIGGGFPGDKNTTKISDIAQIVNKSLDYYFPKEETNHIHIISEPGRFFVASSHILMCKVHSKREVRRDDKLEKTMYFINDGVYGSFNCILYDHQVITPKYLPEREEDERKIMKTYKSSLWGPTCDALDQICDNCYLPNLKIGDLLVFENMGAYTLPIASPFNGFPLPKVKFFMNEKYRKC